LEQFQNPIEKYHTVGTAPKSNRKIIETETKPFIYRSQLYALFINGKTR
jgi:hypothetical protein